MTTRTGCDCGGACGGACAGRGPTAPEGNLPGQRALRWRVAPHGTALARMREHLAEPAQDLAVRSLATQPPADPTVALLDTWAVVTDVVSFYTERIAQEGFLRTATETASVRQLARTLGYELRPGAAARVELAFAVESAPTAPLSVDVPAGTPVQSVPPPGKLPQTFETTADLVARVAWNAVPGLDRIRQTFTDPTDVVWLDSTAPVVEVDDRVLLVGPPVVRPPRRERPRRDDDTERWALRRVTAVEVDPPWATGWTRVTLHEPVTFAAAEKRTLGDVRVLRLTRRLSLFGHNAPRTELLQDEDKRVAFVTTGIPDELWPGWALSELEIDGDVPELVPGSWLALESGDHVEAFEVTGVSAGGARRFAVANKVTRVDVDDDSKRVVDFDRESTLVHAVSEELPTVWMPAADPVGAPATTLDVLPTVPPLEVDLRVLVVGVTPDDEEVVEAATVIAVQQRSGETVPAGGAQRLTLDPPLQQEYRAGSVVLHANVADATHGETTEQVLGSGDGAVAFPRFTLRKAPLTYVSTTANAAGVVAELEVRVEDVAWAQVESLLDAGPTDQVYVVRQSEDGVSTVVFGDGLHGSRLPSGAENVRATYRAGIGAAGVADAGAVMLPVRRPRGIATVTNPAATHDWAPPEDLDGARTNAPQRIRTLDRAVSVADYADFARGYARVGRASAHLVWDGRTRTIVVSVLGVTGDPATTDLLSDLQDTLDDAREQRGQRVVLPGEVVPAVARLGIHVDPRYEVAPVLAAVQAALVTEYAAMDLATSLAASSVLVTAAGVEGVESVTMPTLSATGLADSSDDLLVAAPARWDRPWSDADLQLLPAQALHVTALVEVLA
ncbi:hypothetical protein [Cellulomonas sp. Leaf334]|uniref:hypothetical protein n=1 Tax=Cellulomonas sp. Leaf334 TaxID=1736339 RepID=UPI0006FCFB8D|nr:hypothetical protein [Cellulomonas sp. Leaf334]KQR16000.1 hypothetical protein ASF78_00700 [Cellulomonas sp. Leaf334]